jgi:hypothetical protein
MKVTNPRIHEVLKRTVIQSPLQHLCGDHNGFAEDLAGLNDSLLDWWDVPGVHLHSCT